ncbi:ADP-ribosylation factor-like protein 16 isoform 2-T4 [Glossina fuscipes fuscipes]
MSLARHPDCLCLGPKRSGKTHLLKALQDPDSIDETSYSTPTVGTSIYNIIFPTDGKNTFKSTGHMVKEEEDSLKIGKKGKAVVPLKSIRVLEIGGNMAPIWRQYFDGVKKLIYVVDTANLCQISSAGKVFYYTRYWLSHVYKKCAYYSCFPKWTTHTVRCVMKLY